MPAAHWSITEQGFLITPAPLTHLNQAPSTLSTEQCDTLEAFAANLSDPNNLRDLPCYDFSVWDAADGRVLERLFALYGYFASAWVHGHNQQHIPESIAKPFVQLAQHVGRPPMLGYAGMVLTNWRLTAADMGFTPQNIELLHTFTDLIDEAWFFRVHVAIEGQAGEILQALLAADKAVQSADDSAVLAALRTIRAGLVQITQTFHEMPTLCDPDTYYQQVRPLLFGFTDIEFVGVLDAPQALRGGSGAQSSVVPAILAALGIYHDRTDLVNHLATMRPYMPLEHQAFIEQMNALTLRQYCAERPPLRDAYNHALRQLMTFRRAHLYFAREYIFAKSTNPIGTGGTDFMSFLSKLIDETEQHLLR